MNIRIIKKILCVFMILSFFIVGCMSNNIDNQSTESTDITIVEEIRAFDEMDAIAKVMQDREEFAHYPKQQGKLEGTIRGGGPAPGIKVPGEFETKIERNEEDGSFIVVFTQYWNYEDFHYNVEGKKGDILNYYWKFSVTGDKVSCIESGGHFPPQSVK